jgi:tRNA(Leu) C34 or U34 (ribose-2'-O)-methylase TrmL
LAKAAHRERPTTRSGFASIGLHNPKDPANVGGVVRAAHAYGVASVAVSGDRFGPNHPANTSAAHRSIPFYRGDLRGLVPFGAVPVAIELCKDAESLFTFKHPRQAFYIFGPEDSSLGASVLDWCVHRVMVPTSICMNLAATVNVVLYDRACKEACR